jgi:hypothetical protein
VNSAKITGTISYVDVDGNTRTTAFGLGCEYSNLATGAIPVPDGTPAGTEFDVPFVGLLEGATLVVAKNCSGQELNAAWGGNWAPHLGPGATMIYAQPVLPAGGRVLSLRFMLTKAQAGDGKIVFYAFGT